MRRSSSHSRAHTEIVNHLREHRVARGAMTSIRAPAPNIAMTLEKRHTNATSRTNPVSNCANEEPLLSRGNTRESISSNGRVRRVNQLSHDETQILHAQDQPCQVNSRGSTQVSDTHTRHVTAPMTGVAAPESAEQILHK